jgi:hypothetical protein
MKITKTNSGVNDALPCLQGHAVSSISLKKKEISSLSTSSFHTGKKKVDISSVNSKDNVHKALKLMRKVDIPPIRTEHNYSPNKIFATVSVIPLQNLTDIERSAHVALHERRIRVCTLHCVFSSVIVVHLMCMCVY